MPVELELTVAGRRGASFLELFGNVLDGRKDVAY